MLSSECVAVIYNNGRGLHLRGAGGIGARALSKRSGQTIGGRLARAENPCGDWLAKPCPSAAETDKQREGTHWTGLNPLRQAGLHESGTRSTGSQVPGTCSGTRSGNHQGRGGPPVGWGKIPTHRHPSSTTPTRAPPARRSLALKALRFNPSNRARSAEGIAPSGGASPEGGRGNGEGAGASRRRRGEGAGSRVNSSPTRRSSSPTRLARSSAGGGRDNAAGGSPGMVWRMSQSRTDRPAAAASRRQWAATPGGSLRLS